MSFAKKFDSLTSLSRWIEETPANGVFKSVDTLNSCGVSDWRTEFTGTETFEAANDLMLSGWSTGVKNIQTSINRLSINVTTPVPTMQLGIAGFAPCVPAYLAGSPRSMWHEVNQAEPAKSITIGYNSVVGGTATASEITENAAKLLSLITLLERSNIRVNLWVGYMSYSGNETCNWCVRVKSSNEPLNLLRVAYPLTHPAMCRRHGLAITERAKLRGNNWRKNYGYAVSTVSKFTAFLNSQGCNVDVSFNFYSLRDSSLNDLIKTLKK